MGQSTQLRPTALVVEDDPDQRVLVATLLEETGHTVIECESAEAAMSVLAQAGGRIAFIFADIRLAGTLDGVDLARFVKRHYPDTTMIVTSGAAGTRVQELPEDATFLQKPWLAIDVLMEAERSLDRHARA